MREVDRDEGACAGRFKKRRMIIYSRLSISEEIEEQREDGRTCEFTNSSYSPLILHHHAHHPPSRLFHSIIDSGGRMI